MLYIKTQNVIINYIKIQNVIYINPIFAPPARLKSPMLYIKIRKVIYKFQKPQKISRLRRETPMLYINFSMLYEDGYYKTRPGIQKFCMFYIILYNRFWRHDRSLGHCISMLHPREYAGASEYSRDSVASICNVIVTSRSPNTDYIK